MWPHMHRLLQNHKTGASQSGLTCRPFRCERRLCFLQSRFADSSKPAVRYCASANIAMLTGAGATPAGNGNRVPRTPPIYRLLKVYIAQLVYGAAPPARWIHWRDSGTARQPWLVGLSAITTAFVKSGSGHKCQLSCARPSKPRSHSFVRIPTKRQPKRHTF